MFIVPTFVRAPGGPGKVPPATRGLRFTEQGDTGREPVNEVLPADWSKLAPAKEPGDGNVPQDLPQNLDVVSGRRPHLRSAAVTSEQHRALHVGSGERSEHRPKVLVGATCVADMELHGRAHPR